MKNRFLFLICGITIVYFVGSIYGAASTYFHFRSYGPYDLVEAEVVSFSIKCKHPTGLAWTLVVKIDGVISEHLSPKIGNFPTPSCFFGYAHLSPSHLNYLKEGERIKVLRDINGKVYLGAYSLVYHIAHFTILSLLLTLLFCSWKRKS